MSAMKDNEREQRRIKIKLLQDINWEKYGKMEIATIVFEAIDIISWCCVDSMESNKNKIDKFSKYYGRDPFMVFGDFMCERDSMIDQYKNKTYK